MQYIVPSQEIEQPCMCFYGYQCFLFL